MMADFAFGVVIFCLVLCLVLVVLLLLIAFFYR